MISSVSFAQSDVDLSTQNDLSLFAQGLFSISTKVEMETLENELKEMSYTRIVRLDWNTQRFFILTKDISDLTELELRSWFQEYGGDLNCIQIGIHGLDEMNTYPFTNCNSTEE